jgi:hypothetical protein
VAGHLNATESSAQTDRKVHGKLHPAELGVAPVDVNRQVAVHIHLPNRVAEIRRVHQGFAESLSRSCEVDPENETVG